MTARSPGIRAQFLVAGALLVATTGVSAAWSAWAFRDVSRVVGETVRDSEQTTAATAALATALEREDDALLLTLSDEERGRRALEEGRAAVTTAFSRLDALLDGPGERDFASAIDGDIRAYHGAGDALARHARDPEARLRYHETVNPLLRRAVAEVDRVRDRHFQSAQEVAGWARDRATSATQILVSVTVAALVLSLLVALFLGRSVVLPIRDLTRVVQAMRRGDFGSRVRVERSDELGKLGEGFNRMADDLEAFRRANISEVIRAKETLEATLAALPDAVVVIESDGSIRQTNPRAGSVLRVTTPERAVLLATLPVPAHTKELIASALRGERRVSAEAVDLSQAVSFELDGRVRRLLPRVVPIEGLPGDQRGAVLVLSDVTDLARLDEMRIELVAVASHELRTPLTTLRMTLLMLKERAAELGARDRELVTTALVGVEQLAGTVDEFLDLTRIEAGQLRLNWDLIHVGVLVGRAIDAFRPQCADARITLTFENGADDIGPVRGDAPRLLVVLTNLLANAVKYTPAGGTIVVGSAVENECATIAIEDSGPGVPAELREQVFDKFFRVEHHRPGTDAGVRGAGIGLYVAREVVLAHRGAIRCEVGPRGGARFVVSLPLSDVEPPVSEKLR